MSDASQDFLNSVYSPNTGQVCGKRSDYSLLLGSILQDQQPSDVGARIRRLRIAEPSDSDHYHHGLLFELLACVDLACGYGI